MESRHFESRSAPPPPLSPPCRPLILKSLATPLIIGLYRDRERKLNLDLSVFYVEPLRVEDKTVPLNILCLDKSVRNNK